MNHPALADSHVHLDDVRFDDDRAAVCERALAAGVQWQVIPGTTAEYWPRIRELCAQGSNLYAAYGLHPMFMAQHRPEHLQLLREWLEREQPVAVGEIGMDFSEHASTHDEQHDYLLAQLKLAREFNLPVILHTRMALDQVTAALRRIGSLRGVVHSFAGSQQQAEQLWKLGFHLGIGGPVTHERAQRLRGIVSRMPLEWLLLESDAPDQPGATHRGQRNEPAFVVDTLGCIATLRGESAEDLAAATTANTRRLFGI